MSLFGSLVYRCTCKNCFSGLSEDVLIGDHKKGEASLWENVEKFKTIKSPEDIRGC